MNNFIRAALIGALVGGPLGFVGVLFYFIAFEGAADHESSGWAVSAATMATPLFAAIGFAIGGICGVVRARKAPLLGVIGWSLIGATIAGIVAAGILICMMRSDPLMATSNKWQDGDVMCVSLYGAMFGFVLGSVYGIVRAGHQTPARIATERKA